MSSRSLAPRDAGVQTDDELLTLDELEADALVCEDPLLDEDALAVCDRVAELVGDGEMLK